MSWHGIVNAVEGVRELEGVDYRRDYDAQDILGQVWHTTAMNRRRDVPEMTIQSAVG